MSTNFKIHEVPGGFQPHQNKMPPKKKSWVPILILIIMALLVAMCGTIFGSLMLASNSTAGLQAQFDATIAALIDGERLDDPANALAIFNMTATALVGAETGTPGTGTPDGTTTPGTGTPGAGFVIVTPAIFDEMAFATLTQIKATADAVGFTQTPYPTYTPQEPRTITERIRVTVQVEVPREVPVEVPVEVPIEIPVTVPVIVTATPTYTLTPTASPTATTGFVIMTASPTPTPTATATATATASPTPTATMTASPTATATPTMTATFTPTATATATASSTMTPTATMTASPTATATPTMTMTATLLPTVGEGS